MQLIGATRLVLSIDWTSNFFIHLYPVQSLEASNDFHVVRVAYSWRQLPTKLSDPTFTVHLAYQYRNLQQHIHYDPLSGLVGLTPSRTRRTTTTGDMGQKISPIMEPAPKVITLWVRDFPQPHFITIVLKRPDCDARDPGKVQSFIPAVLNVADAPGFPICFCYPGWLVLGPIATNAVLFRTQQ